MRAEFPYVKFSGDIFHPGDLQVAAAQLLQMVFFGGLAVTLLGRGLLPEPAAKFLEGNQMMVLGGLFLCNIVAGNLLNTGAFEISYNEAPVWSKIETGRFPQMHELRDSLAGVGLVSGAM